MTSLERSEEANRRRKSNELPPKARLDEPLGPPPIASLSRCSVCGEEMVVKAASIDGGIGLATFHQEYHEGLMPKVGCPGWNGYTMEYVDQEP